MLSTVSVPHQPQHALHTVVNEAERARLLPVTPHLKVSGRSQRLATEGGGRLLAAALPRAVGTVDVVEAGHAHLDAKVLLVVHTQLLADQLLQAVRVLGLCGPGVALLQRRDIGLRLRTHSVSRRHTNTHTQTISKVDRPRYLAVLWVHTRARAVEKALGSVAARGLEHVEADHGVVVQNNGVIRLDEAHSNTAEIQET